MMSMYVGRKKEKKTETEGCLRFRWWSGSLTAQMTSLDRLLASATTDLAGVEDGTVSCADYLGGHTTSLARGDAAGVMHSVLGAPSQDSVRLQQPVRSVADG